MVKPVIIILISLLLITPVVVSAEWRIYKVPAPIYRGATFYTDTGYKVEVTAMYDVDQCDGGSSTTVYSPDGKVYATASNRIPSDPNKIYVSYSGSLSSSANPSWSPEHWFGPYVSGNKITYFWDVGSGWPILNDYTIYINEKDKSNLSVSEIKLTCSGSAERLRSRRETTFTSGINIYGISGQYSAVCGDYHTYTITGDLVFRGDVVAPIINNTLAREIASWGVNGRIMTKSVCCWSYEYNYYKRYPVLKATGATNDKIYVSATDDYSKIKRYYARYGEDSSAGVDVGESTAYLTDDSASLTVSLRKTGGSWVKASDVKNQYALAHDFWTGSTTCCIYFGAYTLEQSANVYFVSASDLGLTPSQQNAIEVKAVDAFGRETTKTMSIYYDTTPPTPAITSPANSANTNTGVITMTGTASDDFGVEKVEVRVISLTPKGSCFMGVICSYWFEEYVARDWATASGAASWSASVYLTAGWNRVEVKATDLAGNTQTTSAQLYSPPTISWLSPSPGTEVSGQPTQFTVDVDSNQIHPTQQGVYAKVSGRTNNGSWVTLGYSGGDYPRRYSGGIQLQNGWNTVDISATDKNGLTGSSTMQFYYTDASPTVSVYSLGSVRNPDGKTFPSSSSNLRIYAKDDKWGNMDVYARLNSGSWVKAGRQYDCESYSPCLGTDYYGVDAGSLSLGWNTIEVKAVDGNGNEGYTSIRVRYSTKFVNIIGVRQGNDESDPYQIWNPNDGATYYVRKQNGYYPGAYFYVETLNIGDIWPVVDGVAYTGAYYARWWSGCPWEAGGKCYNRVGTEAPSNWGTSEAGKWKTIYFTDGTEKSQTIRVYLRP